MEARRERQRGARKHYHTSLPAPTWSSQPGPNLLPKRHSPGTPAQSPTTELLPRRQAQPKVVRKQRGLCMLRTGQVVRCHTRPATVAGIRTYCAARDDAACCRVVGRVCPARRPRVFDCTAECNSCERPRIYSVEMQLHCAQHVWRVTSKRYALPVLQFSQ